MAKTITYVCPNCGGQILHEVDENGAGSEFEVCGMCGTKSLIKDLENKPAMQQGMNNGGAVVGGDAMVTYIDDAESALAYLENFFENYNWEDFMYTSALSVPSVDKMVDKILIKSAANPATWELQFMAVTTPLVKKLNALKKLEAKFFEEYIKNDDLAESFSYFDTYRRVVNKICAEGEGLLKKLTLTLKYYQKYNGNPAVLQQMNAQLFNIKENISAVTPVKDHKELPGYAAAQATKQNEISQKLAARSINAEEVYMDAVNAYQMGGDLRNAFEKFTSIAGYKDANEYANKIDSWLRFKITDGSFIKLGKKHYMLRKVVASAFSLANLGQKANDTQTAETETVTSYKMFEVTNKTEAEEPAVTDISKLLTYVGGHLFYLNVKGELCAFNSEEPDKTKAVQVLIAGEKDDLIFNIYDDELFFADNKLYVLRKLTAVEQEEEKKGCFAKLFKKNKTPEAKIVNKNNFSLIAVDLITDRTRTVVPELVDIHFIGGKEIFYNKVTVVGGIDKEDFFAYNYETSESRTVLSADTEIVDVVNGKVIYFLWTPNDYNKDLYAYDIASGESTLLDKNTFDYYGGIEGKIYYYVGNDDIKTLYRINIDGTNKKEIRSNTNYFGKVISVRNGWLYLKTGYGINTSLAKMSPDGEKFVVLCPNFKDLIKIEDGYVYYLDYKNSLIMAREDGGERKKILDDVEGFIEVAEDGIYLLRRETVDETSTAYIKSNSLYKVNSEGAGLTKVAFDIDNAAMSSDRSDIYLYKTNKVTYSISVPVDKDNYNTTYEVYTIKTVVSYNIKAKTFTEVAEFGRPVVNGTYTFKSGCFKKPVSKETIVKEVSNKKSFKRNGVISAGAVAGQQMQQINEASAQNNAGTTRAVSASRNVKTGSAAQRGGATQKRDTSIMMLVISVLLFVYSFALIGMGGPKVVIAVVMGIVVILGDLANGFFAFRKFSAQKAKGVMDKKVLAALIISIVSIVVVIIVLIATSSGSSSVPDSGYDYGSIMQFLNMFM